MFYGNHQAACALYADVLLWQSSSCLCTVCRCVVMAIIKLPVHCMQMCYGNHQAACALYADVLWPSSSCLCTVCRCVVLIVFTFYVVHCMVSLGENARVCTHAYCLSIFETAYRCCRQHMVRLRHMAKPRPQVVRVCWSHHQNTSDHNAPPQSVTGVLNLSKKKN